MLLSFDDYRDQSRRLAAELGLERRPIGLHRFPDGESKVTVPGTLPDSVVLCRSLDHPNDKLVELLLAARAARDCGARHLTLVAPYLCYMRQDAAFSPGEAVSQRIVGGLLAQLFDCVVTVDPHLHRTRELSVAVPAGRALAVSAAAAVGAFLKDRLERALLLGPDSESAQWVQAAAGPGGFDFAVCEKARHGDRHVNMRLPDIDLVARNVVVVDDVASTGRTVAAAAANCLERGAASVDVFVTHPLFVEDALHALRRAGVRQVWSTDSIAHPSNAVALAATIAAALRSGA